MRTAATALRKPLAGHPLNEIELFALDIIRGLSNPAKSLPSKYFYDARGSELFEEITALPEYYPTRTETRILEQHAAEMVLGFEDARVLIEFGSGSSRKTEILLEALPASTTYVPIDVSEAALDGARKRLNQKYPDLDIRPVAGDFRVPVPLPPEVSARPKLGFFPGSTIGNFEHADAVSLLAALRSTLGRTGRLIVGADLVKFESVLVPAYNDAAGVTAAFNLNLLARINRTFGKAFDLSRFRHEAIFDPVHSRIEMRLVSRGAQTVSLLGRHFEFQDGEFIVTEYSHKYSLDSFTRLARAAGWRPASAFTDDAALFSIHILEAT